MSREIDLKTTNLYAEVNEQPRVIKNLIRDEKDNLNNLAEEILAKSIKDVIIAARGTSDNAGRYAKYLLGAVNRMPVGLAAPSLFTIYKRPPVFGNSLVIGISQSGKSPDIVAVVQEARRQGALTAVFTNTPGSDLAEGADFVIDLHAGEERSVAATKTYTAELAAIAALSAALAKDSEMKAEIQMLPEVVAGTLELEVVIEEIVSRYRYMRECVVIGRGYNYATAFEIALKLKELTYTIAEPYSSADFLHGPLAMLENGFPVIVCAPSGVMVPELQTFIKTLQRRDAEVIVISDDESILNLAQVPIRLPVAVPEWLSPITVVIPGQLLALNLAVIRGYDPDAPRAIHKITETL
jgi:glucosamine--fructose-6-phosphate aminotransferase (isomerizing)